jgi:hypothetical protein
MAEVNEVDRIVPVLNKRLDRAMHVRTRHPLTTSLVIPHGYGLRCNLLLSGRPIDDLLRCGTGRPPRDAESPKPRTKRPPWLPAGSQPAREAPRRATLQASAGRRTTAPAHVPTSSRGRHPHRAPRHEDAATNEEESRQHGDRKRRAHANHVRSPRHSAAHGYGGLRGLEKWLQTACCGGEIAYELVVLSGGANRIPEPCDRDIHASRDGERHHLVVAAGDALDVRAHPPQSPTAGRRRRLRLFLCGRSPEQRCHGACPSRSCAHGRACRT